MAAVAGSWDSKLLGWSRAQLGWSLSSGIQGKKGSAHMWNALIYSVVLPDMRVSIFPKLHHKSTRDFSSSPISKSLSGSRPFPRETVIILYSRTLM